MSKNYLLFMPSLMADDREPFTYTVSGEDKYRFTSSQTNIPATEYVASVLSEQNEQIDKIIMFCSEEVLNDTKRIVDYGLSTTIDYYKKTICNFLLNKGYGHERLSDLFEIIPLKDINPGDKTRMDGLLNDLSDRIDKTGNLYVDYTGGLRSAAILLIFFTRYLQKDGMNIKKMLYSNISSRDANGNCMIEDYMDTFMLFEWLDAEANAENGNLEKIQQMAKNAGMSKIETVLEKEQQTNMKMKSQQYDSITAEEKKEIDVSKEQSLYQKNVLKALNKNKRNNAQDDIVKKVKSGDISKGIQDIRERGYEKLISNGIIEWESNCEKRHIADNFYAYVNYYVSYLEFAKETAKRICEDGADSIDELITELFSLKPADKINMSVTDRIIREFERKNKSISISEGSDEFAEKLKYMHTYCRGGFPFGNIQNGYSYSSLYSERFKRPMWYSDEYKRELKKRIKSYSASGYSNDEKNLIKSFPPIDMGLFKLKNAKYEELGELLVIMYKIRKLRNITTHGRNATVAQLEEAKQLVYDYEEWIENHKGGSTK